MRERDCYVVNLDTKNGRREIVPYIDGVINDVARGVLISPSGTLTNLSGATETKAGLTPQEIVAEALNEHVINVGESENVTRLVGIVNYILFNPDNPHRLNPFTPGEDDLLSRFVEQHDEKQRELAAELWDYGQREIIKSRLEVVASRSASVRVMGQLAAGKTTFLHTLARELSLESANLAVVAREPEDDEIYYPDLETLNNYLYRRNSTRGINATLGSETVNLFGFSPLTGELTKVEIASAGGHAQAERVSNDCASTAFFIDFSLMRELVNLDINYAPDHRLGNKETVAETVLSLITRIKDWGEATGPRLGVATKLPGGMRMSDDILDMFNKAYEKVIVYGARHFDRLNLEAMYSGFELEVPDKVDIKMGAKEWLSISDDYPKVSGTLEVSRRLIELANDKNSHRGRNPIRLVTFGEGGTPDQIHYSEVLNNFYG